MPRDLALEDRARALTGRYRGQGTTEMLAAVGADPDIGRLALVSSFGADSVVLLHLIATVDPARPVLFIDTEMLFPETLAYQTDIARRLDLRDLRIIRAPRGAIAAHDPDGQLHKRDPDACCALRKAEPLDQALGGFDAWITGRKRYQGGQRATLDLFEADAATGRLKINPLAHWQPADLAAYMDRHDLPRHPLVAKGYRSIGCAPCTSPVAAGEDDRAGRWRGQDKDECGIHFVDGKLVRGPRPAAA